MAKPLTYNATLARRHDLTEQLALFTVQTDDPLPAVGGRWFIPGQYVAIGLNNEEKPELGSVRRAMSIASAPQESHDIEFYIRYVSRPESNNPLTHLLWKIGDGDRMHVRVAPTGKFTVQHTVGDDDPRLRIYVAAGTGLAPFRSMVRAKVLDDPRADLSRDVILHGASYPSDLGYREELAELAEENGLRYFPTVSRPNEAPDWSGDVGRVEDFFRPERIAELEDRLGLRAGEFNCDNVAVFVCGLQGTIGTTITRLLGRRIVPDNRKLRKGLEIAQDVKPSLFFEQYDNTPVLDLKDEELVGRLKSELAAALAAG